MAKYYIWGLFDKVIFFLGTELIRVFCFDQFEGRRFSNFQLVYDSIDSLKYIASVVVIPLMTLSEEIKIETLYNIKKPMLIY